MAIDDMAIDEGAKEQDQVSSNVRPFVPRAATSALKTERGRSPFVRDRNVVDNDVVDNDDDPGPSAA